MTLPHSQLIKKLVHNIYNYCECTPSTYLKRRQRDFGSAMNYCIYNSKKTYKPSTNI